MDTKQQEQGHATRAEIAQGFHDAAAGIMLAGKDRDAGRAVRVNAMAVMLAGVALGLGYLTREQVVASNAIGKQEAQANLDTFTAGRAVADEHFEPLARHYERLAAFIDAAGPTDTVPPITVVPEPAPARLTREAVVAKYREFARRDRAGENVSIESGLFSLNIRGLGYVSERAEQRLAWQAAQEHPAVMGVNDAQYPRLMELIADFVEHGEEPVPVPAFSPDEQFVAQRAFAGPQPHRFTREVM